ncbi:hypothetical protein SGRIM128S_01823 [Streptomyces griseomycini]
MLAGFVVMLLVATGLRERVNDVIYGLRKAIAIGIGLFIMLIGLVDAGFVSRIPDAAHTTVPLLGSSAAPVTSPAGRSSSSSSACCSRWR